MFNSNNPKDLIESLCNEIERHNKLYYIDANPEISDKVFDDLLHDNYGLCKLKKKKKLWEWAKIWIDFLIAGILMGKFVICKV